MSMGLSAGTWAAIGVGGSLLLQSMNKPSNPSPDPAIGQAANTDAKVAADTLDWYKQKDAEMKPFRDQAEQIALDQARTQTDTAQKQNAMADETYNYTKSTFRPLEQKIASDALGYDTTARRNAEADAAMADVQSNVDAQRESTQRSMDRMGVNPNSGQAMALNSEMDLGAAKAKAGAAYTARKNVEAVGAAKLADAANLGRGIATSNATQTQLGLQAGNSAVGNATTPLNIDASRGSQMAQGTGLAINGNTSGGNLALGQYSAQVGAEQAANSSTNGLLSAIGTGVGAYYGAQSDKNIKHDRKKISGKVSLAQVKKLPANETWRYKKGSVADDGGQLHEGHMAQDVNRVMGEEAAPKGKMINLEHLAATGLAAIKEVAKNQERTEKRVIRLENARRKAA